MIRIETSIGLDYAPLGPIGSYKSNHRESDGCKWTASSSVDAGRQSNPHSRLG